MRSWWGRRGCTSSWTITALGGVEPAAAGGARVTAVSGGADAGLQPVPGLAPGGADVERLPQPLVWAFSAGPRRRRHPHHQLEHGRRLWFAFLGVPRHGVVAVATVGLRWQQDATARAACSGRSGRWWRGCPPSLVLCYGRTAPPAGDGGGRRHPTRWQSIRQARAMMRQRGPAPNRTGALPWAVEGWPVVRVG